MRKIFILNKELRGWPIGYKFSLDVNKEGIPIDKYWAERFLDSKVDNCMSIYKESKVEKAESKGKK